MRQGKAIYVFPGSNTPNGYQSFYPEGLATMETVFILKGGPGCGKSTLMRKIGLNMQERGYNVEFWQCSSDNESLDGVLIPALSVAIIDGTSPHLLDPKYPGAVDEIVNLGEHWDAAALRRNKQEIIQLSGSISECFAACYKKLADAGKLYQEGFSAQQEAVDEAVLEKNFAELARAVFQPEQPRCRHLFSSAVTPRGLVDVAEALSLRAEQRYILSGPAGGGKERLIARLAEQAQRQGHFLEIFHNTLAPQHIELLYFPHLSIAVLASDRPLDSVRDNDRVIPCGQQSDGTPARQAEIEQLTAAAALHISEAKSLHDDLEQYYKQAIDFSGVEETGTAIFNRILAIAAEADAKKS